MEYLNPTDARILLRRRLGHFLNGPERLFVVIGRVYSGRKTIINRLLEDLSLEERAEYCLSDAPITFYEYLNRFEEADVLLIEDRSMTAAEGKRQDWYMDALDRIYRGLPVKHPDGPREDDFSPSSVRVRQKVILLVEAQHRYDPMWKKISGIAFDESAVDLHNYVQQERASILKTYSVSEASFSRATKELRALCRSQPEYFAKPKPGSTARLTEFIGAMQRLDAGEDDWNEFLESWHDRAHQELRAKRHDTYFELDTFHILDGVRGQLILPRMIEAFLQGNQRLFSFILRYPVHLQRWHDTALQNHIDSDKIIRMVSNGPSQAAALYDALAKGRDGAVVIADYLIDTSARSNDGKDVITMIHQVAAGETVTRPRRADDDLPESIEFSGKLFLLDEGVPKSGKMRQLVENHPGLQIQDSFADTVHRLSWWDADGISDSEIRDELEQLQPAAWNEFMEALFSFVVRFPDQTVTRTNTGPSEDMLFKARKAVVASGGDLHDVDDFKLESDIKKLREEAAQPDRTAASFADRVGPSQ